MIRTAPALIAWLLRSGGYAGITMPWGVVYITPERIDDAGLRAHESVHLMQIERDGAWLFTARVIWYLLRYGYDKSPYELEARRISGVN